MTSPFSYQPYGAQTATEIPVLLGSVSGLTGETTEIHTAYNSEYTGMVHTRTTAGKRELTFKIPVSADTPANLNTAIRTYADLFRTASQPGRLICAFSNPARYLSVYPAGSPVIEYQSNTAATLAVKLTAPSPYWWDTATQTVYQSGTPITNAGTYSAPVTMTVDSGATAVTLSVGGTVVATISRRGTESIAGVTITVSDEGVSATDSNGDALSRFDLSSMFFEVPPGTSTIIGASSIMILQRWGCP